MSISVVFLVLAATGVSPRATEQETTPEYFEESGPAVELKTVWDFRFVSADTTASWLDAALGKARYGGDGSESRNLFRLPQASFVLETHLASTFTTHVHVNLDLEPEVPEGRYGWDRIRLIEAFADWHPSLGDALELRAKGGMFFPPISLEHIGEAWTTFYSITPSAINAWVGEEVRATGAELALAHVGEANEIAVKGAAFVNNDPTGSLLAYRGFAIHDRQTGWRDRVPVPPIPSLQPGGTFGQQAPYVEPLVEIDERVGYYGALSWQNYAHFEVNALYFDNRGVPDRFDGEQYAWNTRFKNVGGVLFLPEEMELLGQWMNGDTAMGFLGPGQPKVTAEFRAWYLLWSAPLGRHRVSVRYEDFRVWDRDESRAPDSSDESGDAWTFSYLVRIMGEHRIAAEVLRIDSDRPARASIGLPINADELMFQLSLRIQF